MLAHQRVKGKMFMSNLIISNFPLKVKKMNEFNVSNLLFGVLLGAIIFGLGLFYMLTHPAKQEEIFLKAEPIVTEQITEQVEIVEELSGGHETVEVTVAEEEEKKPILSDEEIIAMVVHAEAQSEPMIGKVAVACVVYNRCDRYGLTVESVVNAKNQFAISDSYTEEDLRAVEIARDNRDLYPENMLYFRADAYHTFGSRWQHIGNHYFSLESEDN